MGALRSALEGPAHSFRGRLMPRLFGATLILVSSAALAGTHRNVP